MKVLITGGGTGGHIYPALAIADIIKEEQPSAEILFVGTERGLERKLVPAYGYEIRFIPAKGIDRKNLAKNFAVIKAATDGLRQARAIIREFKPDFAIGTGGYVCGPVLLGAKQEKIPYYLHEQNAFPGLTNKLLAGGAEKIFLGFEEGGKHFKQKNKLVVTGNPVRKDFFTVDKAESRRKLGIPESAFMVLSFGGSGGAGAINTAMISVARFFNGLDEVQVYMGAGANYYKAMREKLDQAVESNIHLLEYLDPMSLYLSAADVVISRAGALTVAEIAACGKAAILIPSPNVTGNHQFFNAKVLADRGGAILLEESSLKGEKLTEEVLRLKKDGSLIGQMEEGSLSAASSHGARRIYGELRF